MVHTRRKYPGPRKASDLYVRICKTDRVTERYRILERRQTTEVGGSVRFSDPLAPADFNASGLAAPATALEMGPHHLLGRASR